MIQPHVLNTICRKSNIINKKCYSLSKFFRIITNNMIMVDGAMYILVNLYFYCKNSHLIGKKSPVYYINLPHKFNMVSECAIAENCNYIMGTSAEKRLKKYVINRPQYILNRIYTEEIDYDQNMFGLKYLFTKFDMKSFNISGVRK